MNQRRNIQNSKQFVLILLLSCLLDCEGMCGWSTNPSSPSLVDLGSLIAGNTQEPEYFYWFSNTNGDGHFIVPYYGGSTGNLVDLNVTASAIKKADFYTGRISGRAAAYTNGVFYFCEREVVGGGSGYGRLTSYIPSTGQTNPLHLTSLAVPMSMEFGANGWLYIGHYGTSCTVDRYNIATTAYEELGVLDTNSGAAYCYYVGADASYVYAYIGPNPYRLSIKTIATGTTAIYWTNLTEIYYPIYNGKAGGLFTICRTNGTECWYGLSNGVPNAIGVSSTFYTNVWYYGNAAGISGVQENWRAGVLDLALTQTNATGYELDMSLSLPNSSNNVASFGYSETTSNSWTWLSVSNFSLSAAGITKLYPDGDNLFAVSFLYGPLLNYNPDADFVTVLGTPPYEIHGAVKTNALWYLSGYNAVTLEYDSTKDWTLFAGVDRASTNINPHTLSLAILRMELYPAFGSDGLLYVAAYRVRGIYGGEIGWWNPSTKETGSYRPSWWEYATNAPSDLVPVLGGTKMVYLPYGWPGLYVFDVATKTVVLTNSSVLPFVSRLEKCVEVSSGVVVGITSNLVWRYNVATDTVTHTNALPGVSWSGFLYADPSYGSRKKLVLGPDGYVWAVLGNDLYRIHPTTCEPELIKASVSPNNVIFLDGDAYLYNPATTSLKTLDELLLFQASINGSGNVNFSGNVRWQ
jgi:hypothetical protein